MSEIKVCDWCHQPIDPDEHSVCVYPMGGAVWFRRDLHSPDYEGNGRHCYGDWLAMVELAEEHRGVMEGLTNG